MCRPRPRLIKARPTLTQETGRTKQPTIMMAFFHQDLFQDELNVLDAHHGGNQHLHFVLGVGERGHFFEKSEIFAMKSA
jgi:hypothetical protein